MLRVSALRTWRYFAEFSTEEHHWLIPDNVQEENTKVAPRVSPTNLGLLLNARQVACQFGYLTVPEFSQQTLRTLATTSLLKKHRGHLLNWYDTRTLTVSTPAIVSSVDSGNLVASLWTLQQGSLDLLNQPLFSRELADGLLDHLSLLSSLGAIPRRKCSLIEKALRRQDWLQYVLDIPDSVLKDIHQPSPSSNEADSSWFLQQAEDRIRQIGRAVQLYSPWLLPEYANVRSYLPTPLGGLPMEGPLLEHMPKFIDSLAIAIARRSLIRRRRKSRPSFVVNCSTCCLMRIPGPYV